MTRTKTEVKILNIVACTLFNKLWHHKMFSKRNCEM